jgi:hypothetical protein
MGGGRDGSTWGMESRTMHSQHHVRHGILTPMCSPACLSSPPPLPHTQTAGARAHPQLTTPTSPATCQLLQVACLVATDILQLVGLRSFRATALLLAGLLTYDAFWVFGSPAVVGDNVMLTVATSNVITGPTRLLFPRLPGGMGEAADFPFSLLGLGDIAIPGVGGGRGGCVGGSGGNCSCSKHATGLCLYVACCMPPCDSSG